MTQDLSQIMATTTNGRLRIRLLAVSHFKEGKNRTQIASFLKVSRTRVNKWIKSYLDNGLTGLQEKAHTRRPKGLKDIQLLQHKNLSPRDLSSPMVVDFKGNIFKLILRQSSTLTIKKLTYIICCMDSI